MRIGELAELSRTPTRSLRYYEEQGLLAPRRLENGYRDYEPHLIDRAVQIRGLIDSGVPTRIIALILPCLDWNRSILPTEIGPDLLVVLREEHERMTSRIDFLTRNRDSLTGYIDAAGEALGARIGAQTEIGTPDVVGKGPVTSSPRQTATGALPIPA